MRVLVTGSAGAVGQAILAPLSAAGHRVSGIDRRPTPGVAVGDARVGELAEPETLRAVLDGVEVVVHLAAAARPFADLEAELIPDTIVPTQRLLDGAVAAGVRRVVLASSMHVVAGHPAGIEVDERAEPRPINPYGASKVMVEALARVAYEVHGLEVVVVRLGALRGYHGARGPRDLARVVKRRLGDAITTLRRRRPAPDTVVVDAANLPRVAIGPGDTAALFRAAVEAPGVGYAVVYGTSAPDGSLSQAGARELLGYEPRDRVGNLFPPGWRPPRP